MKVTTQHHSPVLHVTLYIHTHTHTDLQFPKLGKVVEEVELDSGLGLHTGTD